MSYWLATNRLLLNVYRFTKVYKPFVWFPIYHIVWTRFVQANLVKYRNMGQ